MLAKLGKPEEAVNILNKGGIIFPDDWRFPLWRGFNYVFYLNDTESALKEFLNASYLPGCPNYVFDLAKGITREIGGKEIAKQFLKGAKDSEKNELNREKINNILKQIEN